MNTTLKVQNLKCGGCANTITTKLTELQVLEHIKVTPEDDSVSFTYKDEETLNNVKKLLIKLGYPEIGDKNALSTKAKSFVSCAIGRMSK